MLAIASIAAIFGGLLWPEASGAGEAYAFADIADQRELWWGLLTGLAIIGILGTTLQAMATMYLVRHRGSTWATIGAGGATAPAQTHETRGSLLQIRYKRPAVLDVCAGQHGSVSQNYDL